MLFWVFFSVIKIVLLETKEKKIQSIKFEESFVTVCQPSSNVPQYQVCDLLLVFIFFFLLYNSDILWSSCSYTLRTHISMPSALSGLLKSRIHGVVEPPNNSLIIFGIEVHSHEGAKCTSMPWTYCCHERPGLKQHFNYFSFHILFNKNICFSSVFFLWKIFPFASFGFFFYLFFFCFHLFLYIRFGWWRRQFELMLANRLTSWN